MATPETEREAYEREQEARKREQETARANRDRQHYDSFRESVATPVPNRTYRSDVDLVSDRPGTAERVVRYVAVALGALLAVRFVINLFATSHTGGFTAFIYATTNWMVRPFQLLLGQPPASTGGFFDWPALAALVVVGIVASVIIGLMRRSP
jgi:Flp pilus assembly protein TadB